MPEQVVNLAHEIEDIPLAVAVDVSLVHTRRRWPAREYVGDKVSEVSDVRILTKQAIDITANGIDATTLALIANAVAVAVKLVRIVVIGAVIADVTHAIGIRVLLVGV